MGEFHRRQLPGWRLSRGKLFSGNCPRGQFPLALEITFFFTSIFSCKWLTSYSHEVENLINGRGGGEGGGGPNKERYTYDIHENCLLLKKVFYEKLKIGRPEHSLHPHPLCPITSLFCLIPSLPLRTPSPPPSLKVNVICVSPLKAG